MVLLGAVLTWITEILGGLHMLRRGPLAAAWLLVALIGAWRLLSRKPSVIRFPRLGLIDWIALAGILAVACLVGIAAVLSAPNSTDGTGYHLPRVVYWAQAASVDFFPTH